MHLGQFLGTVHLAIALLALARPLSRQRGLPGALALVGAFTTVVLTVVVTVQMAVNGVGAAGDGAHLGGRDRTGEVLSVPGRRTALRSGQGPKRPVPPRTRLTLLALGLSLSLGRPSRAGWDGRPLWRCSAFLGGGLVMAHIGLSNRAALFLHPALVLLAVFHVGSCVTMLKQAGQAPAVADPPTR